MGPDADFPAAELAPQAPLKFYESALSDHALFLAPLTDRLVLRWAELYLNVLGGRSFFSAQRVEKLFRELTEVFVACLKEKCLEIYFETLRQKGELFSSLGVPFEEVLLSLHLFEETCLEQFLESYPDRTRLPELLLGLEQLHNEGLSCLAASYFETTKAKLQKLTVSLQEENELLKSELSESKDSFFSKTSKELGSMQLLISGINQKLRNRVYQQSRVQKIADAMDNECHLPKLLSIASRHLLALCPSGSEVFFGLFDEDRTKVNAYAGNSDSSLECAPYVLFFGTTQAVSGRLVR
jgi:hypothetical protein